MRKWVFPSYPIPRIDSREYEASQPFNQVIESAIHSETAIGVIDANAKHAQMSGKWILVCKNKSFELSNILYHKNWSENTRIRVEAITLLELLEVVKRKGRNISSGRLTIGLANSKVH